MTQSTTQPRRALGTGWSLALAADMTVTVLVAAVLGVIGLLLPGITEDHEMSDAEHFAEAAVFYGSSAFLLMSLGATRLLLRREQPAPSRSMGFRRTARSAVGRGGLRRALRSCHPLTPTGTTGHPRAVPVASPRRARPSAVRGVGSVVDPGQGDRPGPGRRGGGAAVAPDAPGRRASPQRRNFHGMRLGRRASITPGCSTSALSRPCRTR